jgi:hypothetical protein
MIETIVSALTNLFQGFLEAHDLIASLADIFDELSTTTNHCPSMATTYSKDAIRILDKNFGFHNRERGRGSVVTRSQHNSTHTHTPFYNPQESYPGLERGTL